ncbi:MAG: hypothetical protein U0871_06430 [Gemmataceae bacterium]
MPRYDDDDDYDDRPRRRRRDDYDDDDDYDDRPRKRKKKKPAGPPVGLIVAGAVGGGLLLLVVAVVAFFLLRPGNREVASVPPPGFNPGPQPFNQPQPGFNPAPQPKNQPSQQPRGQSNQPPKGDGAPAQSENALTLTAARRGTSRFGKPTLEIDYSLNGGGFVGGGVVVKIKGPDGTSEANLIGGLGIRPGERSGTISLEEFGFRGDGFRGPLEIWVERKLGFAGNRISNTITLN